MRSSADLTERAKPTGNGQETCHLAGVSSQPDCNSIITFQLRHNLMIFFNEYKQIISVYLAVACARLPTPANGNAIGSNIMYGSEMRFECHHGFKLMGSEARICSQDGSWTGKDTSCKRNDFLFHIHSILYFPNENMLSKFNIFQWNILDNCTLNIRLNFYLYFSGGLWHSWSILWWSSNLW